MKKWECKGEGNKGKIKNRMQCVTLWKQIKTCSKNPVCTVRNSFRTPIKSTYYPEILVFKKEGTISRNIFSFFVYISCTHSTLLLKTNDPSRAC